jgi:hypothetical protein
VHRTAEANRYAWGIGDSTPVAAGSAGDSEINGLAAGEGDDVDALEGDLGAVLLHRYAGRRTNG